MAGFFSLFTRKKVESITENLKGVLVDIDRETATEADLAQVDDQLRRLSEKAADAQNAYQKEQREADAAVAAYKRQYSVAQHLQKQVDDATDDAQKASLSESLNRQLDILENSKKSVDKEQAEAADAKKMSDQYQDMVRQIGEKLRNRRAELRAAGTRIDRAKLAVERGKDLLESQKITEGITTSKTTVLDSMNNLASKYEKEAESLNIHKSALTTPEVPVDENIKAAEAAVDGTEKPTNTKDRLAGLAL